ncbi:MAG: hypothetical protein E7A06_13240 [Clostridiales bacterium]|nr:hypothetical protein [Clostridiales bacterium]
MTMTIKLLHIIAEINPDMTFQELVHDLDLEEEKVIIKKSNIILAE